MPKVIVDIPGTGPIDLNKVIKLLPQVQGWNFFRMTTQQRYILGIVQAWPRLLELEINTPLRMGHFLGQGLVETGWLRYASENLQYSAKGLIATFSVYRNNPALAARNMKKPELIAETVLILNIDGEPVTARHFVVEAVPRRLRMRLPVGCPLLSNNTRP